MAPEASTAAKGLQGVVIAQTQLSSVNGTVGKLQYHGYNIKDLAENALFEEVVYLLWNHKLPTQAELDGFMADLAADRVLPPELLNVMKYYPRDAHPMGVLRAAISTLGILDPGAEDTDFDGILDRSRRLTAIMGTIVAAWERIRSGLEPVAPCDDLSLAANFLYMLRGKEPTGTEVDAINAYLVMLADHGMNASTFSARVTTSTLSDIYSAVTTAIGTLKGPAHGGAAQKAMEQFTAIGSPDNVVPWFEDMVQRGTRIMGIGHRVYKTEDPRATILRDRARELAESSGDRLWFDIAWQLEQQARSNDYFIQRDLYANVDYYSAVVLYQVGIPADQFTSLFAMSRIAGWCAHIGEQWADNRLIRPRAEYVGPQDQPWIPLGARA
jgi:citrate synthase